MEELLKYAHSYLLKGDITKTLGILVTALTEISTWQPEYVPLLQIIQNTKVKYEKLKDDIENGKTTNNKQKKKENEIFQEIQLFIDILQEAESLKRGAGPIRVHGVDPKHLTDSPVEENYSSPKPKKIPEIKLLTFLSTALIKLYLNFDKTGKIVYESPSKMRLNHAESVTVRISHKSLKEDVLKEGLDAAKTKEGELEISDSMEVSLFEVGPQQNFDIFPLNIAEQLLNKTSYTQWCFCLNAKRVGKFGLILRVSMKVHLPELGEKKKDIVTWSTSIEVDVESETQMENIPVRSVKWNDQFIKTLKERIANNDFGIVFQNLANHLSTCDTELFNNLVVLQTRFNNLETAQQLGVLSHQDYTIDFNRIAGSLLSLIDEVGSPRKSGAIETYKTTLKDIAEQVA